MRVIFEIEEGIADAERARTIRDAVENMLRNSAVAWKVTLRRTFTSEGFWFQADAGGFHRSRAVLDLNLRDLTRVLQQWLHEWASEPH